MLNSDMSDPMVDAQSQAASDRRNFLAALREIRSGYTSGGDGSPDGKSDVGRYSIGPVARQTRS
jgi:hypothetical protein